MTDYSHSKIEYDMMVAAETTFDRVKRLECQVKCLKTRLKNLKLKMGKKK